MVEVPVRVVWNGTIRVSGVMIERNTREAFVRILSRLSDPELLKLVLEGTERDSQSYDLEVETP